MKVWLIQRGKINKGNNFNGITGNNGFAKLDYMGSAEFEWGAIPKAYRRIMGQFAEFSVIKTDLKNLNGVPFCIYCKMSKYQETVTAITEFLKNPYELKEWSNLEDHFDQNNSEMSRHGRQSTNFWWDIQNDWIGFFGTDDRVKIFTETVSKDFKDWWMEKSEAERAKEYKEAFK